MVHLGCYSRRAGLNSRQVLRLRCSNLKTGNLGYCFVYCCIGRYSQTRMRRLCSWFCRKGRTNRRIWRCCPSICDYRWLPVQLRGKCRNRHSSAGLVLVLRKCFPAKRCRLHSCEPYKDRSVLPNIGSGCMCADLRRCWCRWLRGQRFLQSYGLGCPWAALPQRLPCTPGRWQTSGLFLCRWETLRSSSVRRCGRWWGGFL